MSKLYDVGVVIGRFQVPELHLAHKQVLEQVLAETRHTLVFLGITPALGTKNDPLDYNNRELMLKAAYPNVQVLPLFDRPTDEEWSENLDTMIRNLYPFGTVGLYGGRDSFQKSYKGRFELRRLPTLGEDNGTDLRKDTGKILINSSDFRAGIIYSTQNQYTKLYMTVDVALLSVDQETDEVFALMGRKGPKALLCFPGGFVDPTDQSLEDAAARELREETGFTGTAITPYFQYVGSYPIDDWRYRKEERIMTAFFRTFRNHGEPILSEELEDMQWVSVAAEKVKLVADQHWILWNALVKEVQKFNGFKD